MNKLDYGIESRRNSARRENEYDSLLDSKYFEQSTQDYNSRQKVLQDNQSRVEAKPTEIKPILKQSFHMKSDSFRYENLPFKNNRKIEDIMREDHHPALKDRKSRNGPNQSQTTLDQRADETRKLIKMTLEKENRLPVKPLRMDFSKHKLLSRAQAKSNKNLLSLKTLSRYNKCIPVFESPSQMKFHKYNQNMKKMRDIGPKTTKDKVQKVQPPTTHSSHDVLPNYNQGVSLTQALSSRLNEPISSNPGTSRRVEKVFELSLNDQNLPKSTLSGTNTSLRQTIWHVSEKPTLSSIE